MSLAARLGRIEQALPKPPPPVVYSEEERAFDERCDQDPEMRRIATASKAAWKEIGMENATVREQIAVIGQHPKCLSLMVQTRRRIDELGGWPSPWRNQRKAP